MFKVNQRVVCIAGSWYIPFKILGLFNWKRNAKGPAKHDIVTITGFNDSGYLLLKEWANSGGYEPSSFRPLDEDFAEEVIKNIISQVKEESEKEELILTDEEVYEQ